MRMIPLQAWLEQHPDASVVDATQGQVGGAKWVQAPLSVLRTLNQLSDYTVAYRGSSWLLKPKAPGRGKYGGPIPVAELDLPRQEESLLREVDALLEAPEKYVIWLKEKGEWVEQGDGEMTLKTAERIVRELRHDFGGAYKILLTGDVP